MYNTLQPLINLTNSNLQAFSRFGKSNEISDITRESMEKIVEIETGSFRQIFNSAAYRDLAQSFWNNYRRFTTECVQGVSNVSDTARKTLDNQLEAAKKPLQTIADAANRTAKAGGDALEQAADTAGNVTRQAAGKAEKVVTETGRAMSNAARTQERDMEDADHETRQHVHQASRDHNPQTRASK